MNQTITPQHIADFKEYLTAAGKNDNTIKKYIFDITRFSQYLDELCGADEHSAIAADTSSYDTSSVDKEHTESDENIAFNELTVNLIESYIDSLKEKGYATSSLNTVICCINTYCKCFGLDINVPNLRRRKASATEESAYLTSSEYSRLIKTAISLEDYRFAILIQVIADTDIRMNELSFITVDTLEDGRVLLDTRADGELEVQLPKQMLDGLREYARRYEVVSGSLFCTSTGKPLDRSNIWKRLKFLAEEAGIECTKVSPRNLKKKQAREYYPVFY